MGASPTGSASFTAQLDNSSPSGCYPDRAGAIPAWAAIFPGGNYLRPRPRTVEVMAVNSFRCARVTARVAQIIERDASNIGDEGEIPSVSTIFSGCKSAADGLAWNEEVGSAILSTLTISRKAGRYKLAAPVLKTGPVQPGVGALPTPSSILRSEPIFQSEGCPR